MLSKNNSTFLDINSLIFKHNEVSLSDFILFLNTHQFSQNHTLLVLYFLILKNNISFWKLVEGKLDFNISESDYLLQLHVLKNFNQLDSIFSQNLENSVIISNLDFKNLFIQQAFFDFSVFSQFQSILYYSGKRNLHSILLCSSPIDKYGLIKNSLSIKQKKSLFLFCISNFRVSSIFILNDLFQDNSFIFTKKVMLSNLNIFSQCNNDIHNYIFKNLLLASKSQGFKTGSNLAYTSFDYEELISFFELLFSYNVSLFLLISSGFISNPQQKKPEVIDYLLKKHNFLYFSDKFKNYSEIKNKIKKI